MEHVTSVTPRDDFKLVLGFDTGETKVFDAAPYLNKSIFKRLQDPGLFKQAYVRGGTVCWRDDLDIAPETLYDRSLPIATPTHAENPDLTPIKPMTPPPATTNPEPTS